MAKTKQVTKQKPTVKPAHIKADFIEAKTFKGEIPSVIGRHRILCKGKETYIYCDAKDVAAVCKRLGNDFVRDLGPVTHENRPMKP